MSTGPLSIDVYVAPMRPYAFPNQLGEGEVATWAPSSERHSRQTDAPQWALRAMSFVCAIDVSAR